MTNTCNASVAQYGGVSHCQSLPMTGLNIAVLVLIAVALVGLGLLLRRATKK